MNGRIISVVVMVLFLTGCATGTGGQPGKTTAVSVPAIIVTFASKTLAPGDTWKVYLKAFDLDGDMKYIFASIDQPGVGSYSPTRLKIKEENARELNGFIFLNTLIPGGSGFLNSVTLTLTVQIRDKTGYTTKPVVFPLSFNIRESQELPPPGVFREEELGPIMVNLMGISPRRAG
jgi:hypothetical protein